MGKTHIYIGDGKGKTTAAVGFACRSSGAGLKVLFIQFMKDATSSEIPQLAKLGVECKGFGRKGFVSVPGSEDIALAQRGLAFVAKELRNFDVVILDEALTATSIGLITPGELIQFFGIPQDLVLTGRHAPKEMLDLADYVSEVRKVKHPFDHGLRARRGVEF